MRLVATLLLLPLLTFAAGCTDQLYGPDVGYVEGVVPGDRATLVGPIEAMVRQSVRPDAGSLSMATPWNDGLISPQLRSDLAGQGYKLVDPGTQADHKLGYVIQTTDQGYLVRVFLDSRDGAQLYARNTAGQLQALGPLVVSGG